MYVMNNLRMPGVVYLVHRNLSFDLREGVPIAVIVVTCVFVIELRRIGSLVRGPESLVVPVFDDVDAVRIQ